MLGSVGSEMKPASGMAVSEFVFRCSAAIAKCDAPGWDPSRALPVPICGKVLRLFTAPSSGRCPFALGTPVAFIGVVEERECRGKHEHANRRYGAKQQNQFSLVLCWTDLCVGAQDRSRLSTHCRRCPERSPVSSSHNPGTTHFRGAVIFDLPRWMKSKVGF